MSLHLVIIDALNLLRRIHSAQKSDDIQHTTNTSCRTLQRILNETQPTHIVAVFDHHQQQRGWRSERFPAYKQDRKPMPTTLLKSLDNIQQAWWELGIDSLLSDGDEADDLIATLATKVAKQNHKVTIISTDKGFCQLLAPTIQIRDYFQHRWLDQSFIDKEFGVKIEQLSDYWGLTGISGTGINGIPGIGAKTATKLLSQYAHLEDIFTASDLADKYRKKITAHEQDALLSRELSRLLTDLELGFNLQDLRWEKHSE